MNRRKAKKAVKKKYNLAFWPPGNPSPRIVEKAYAGVIAEINELIALAFVKCVQAEYPGKVLSFQESLFMYVEEGRLDGEEMVKIKMEDIT